MKVFYYINQLQFSIVRKTCFIFVCQQDALRRYVLLLFFKGFLKDNIFLGNTRTIEGSYHWKDSRDHRSYQQLCTLHSTMPSAERRTSGICILGLLFIFENLRLDGCRSKNVILLHFNKCHFHYSFHLESLICTRSFHLLQPLAKHILCQIYLWIERG